MSEFNFDIDSYKKVIYDSVLDVHLIDGISWDELTNACGYSGPSSLKNIVQQGAYDLEFARGLRLMKFLSTAHNNKRLHKHVIDTNEEMIVSRPKMERARGEMGEDIIKAVESLSKVRSALLMHDHRSLDETYQVLLKFLARLREEIECSRSVIAKIESNGANNG